MSKVKSESNRIKSPDEGLFSLLGASEIDLGCKYGKMRVDWQRYTWQERPQSCFGGHHREISKRLG